jgi:hypothetical protein
MIRGDFYFRTIEKFLRDNDYNRSYEKFLRNNNYNYNRSYDYNTDSIYNRSYDEPWTSMQWKELKEIIKKHERFKLKYSEDKPELPYEEFLTEKDFEIF